MAKPESFRQFVEARAGGSCEYCRLLQIASGVTFHVEHVVPRSRGGQTTVGNLALSCPGCNFSKGEQLSGLDANGKQQRLFNPREYEPWLLGWHLHFALNLESGFVAPRTPIGEATVLVLQMNSARRIFARRLQIKSGLIA